MKKIIGLLFLFSLLLTGLTSCSTEGVMLENQNYSLADFRQAILANIGEPRALSQNQRTYTSAYFSLKPDPKFNPIKSKQRAYARVVVLGDRRPYDLNVVIVVEGRDQNGEYSEVGEDLTQANQLAQQIKKRLHQSTDDRNVIDDFRAF